MGTARRRKQYSRLHRIRMYANRVATRRTNLLARRLQSGRHSKGNVPNRIRLHFARYSPIISEAFTIMILLSKLLSCMAQKKEIWRIIISVVTSALTALATALGVS